MGNSPSSSNNKQQEETGFSHLQSLLLITYADGFASQATFSRLLDRCFLYRTKVQLGLILPRDSTISPTHFSLKGWEDVLFELGSERVKEYRVCSAG